MPRKKLEPRCKRYPDENNPKHPFFIFWSEPTFSKAKGKIVERTKRKPCGTTDQKEATAFFNGWLKGETDKVANEGRMTVGEAETYFIEYHVKVDVFPGKNDKNLKHIYGNLNRVCTFFGRDTYMGDLGPDDITKYLLVRRAGKLKGPWKIRRNLTVEYLPPCSDNASWHDISSFRAMRNFCLERGKLKMADCFKIKIPEPDFDIDEVKAFTVEEVEEMTKLAQTIGHCDKAKRYTSLYRWLIIAIATGRRTEAIETLRWDRNIIWEKGEMVKIDFRRREEGKGGALKVMKETKKRRGVIPISDWLRPHLAAFYAQRLPGNPWVLDTDGSKYLSFKRLCAMIGLPEAHPHMTRHTFGTWKVNGVFGDNGETGANPWDVAETMGCTVKTAQKHYFHGTAAHKQKVLKKFSPPVGFGAVKLAGSGLRLVGK